MSRWRRQLFLLFRLAVTAFAFISAYAWHRSYSIPDALVRISPDRQYTRLLSSDGYLAWQTAPDCPYEPSGWRWIAKTYNGTIRIITLGAPSPAWEQTAVIKPSWPMDHVIDLGGPTSFATEIRLPYAAVVLPTACIAAIGLTASLRHHRASVRRRQRISRGCCAQCGYDLRTTPTRCPECGQKTAARVVSG